MRLIHSIRDILIHHRPGLPSALLTALLTALCIGLVMGPTVSGGLFWDDHANLGVAAFEWGPGGQLSWAFTSFHGGHYQPLTWLSWFLDHALWGDNWRGWHVHNLVLHWASAVLVAVLIRQLAGARGRSVSPWIALLGALLWALHPMRLENVAWLTERRDLLAALFYLAAVSTWLYWRVHRRAVVYALFLALAALSLLAKAWAITLPVVLPLIAWWLSPPAPRTHQTSHWLKARFRETAPLWPMALAAAMAASQAQSGAGAMLSFEVYGLGERLLQSGYGWVFYLAASLWPVDYRPLYELGPVYLFSPLFFGTALLTTLTLGGATLWARRLPGAFVSLAVYTVLLLPVLGISQSGPQLVALRYGYLASIPLVIALILWLSATSGRHRPVSVLLPITLTLALFAHAESRVWSDELTHWAHATQLAPDSKWTWTNLAMTLERKKRMADAATAFQRALDIDAGFYPALEGRIRALSAQGLTGEAHGALLDALMRYPYTADLHHLAALNAANRGDLGDAEHRFSEALRLRPDDWRARLDRASLRLHRGDFGGARRDIATIPPGSPGFARAEQLRAGLDSRAEPRSEP
ncbi:MAG: tetratricopeptide repeat protein [Gammaproteobacteria bacterium]